MPTGQGMVDLKAIQILNDQQILYPNLHNGHLYCPMEQVAQPVPTISLGSKTVGALVREGYAKRIGRTVRSTNRPLAPSSTLDGWADLPYQDRLDLAHDVRHGPTVLSPEDLKLVYDWVWDLHAELVADIKRLIADYETQS